MKAFAIAAFAATMLSAGVANAALVVTEGQVNQQGEVQLFLQSSDGTSGLANYGSQTGTPIFTITAATSTAGNTTFGQSNGFAVITPDTGLLTSITITAPTGYVFNDLVVDLLGPPNGQAATQASFTAIVNGSTTNTISFADIGNGLNEFLANISAGGLMSSITITSTTGFTEAKQFEISGLTQVPVPPAALLFGTALAGLGILGRRRRKQQIV